MPPGFSYGPDVSFQSEQSVLDRRRKLAEALQSQSMQPIQSARPDAPISWTQGLAQMLNAYAGKKKMNEVDQQQQALAQQQEGRRRADVGLLVNALTGRKAQPKGLYEDASGNVTESDAIPAQTPMESLKQALPMINDPAVQQAAMGAYLPLAQQDVRRQQLMAMGPPQQAPQGNPMVPGQPGSSVMAGSGSSVPQMPQQPPQQGPQWGGPVGGIPMEMWLQIDPTGAKYAAAYAEQNKAHGSVQYDQQGRAFVVTHGGQPQYLNGITARDKMEMVNAGGQTVPVNPYTQNQPIPHTLTPADQYRIPLDLSKHFFETGLTPPPMGGQRGPAVPQAGPQPMPQPGSVPPLQPPQPVPQAGGQRPANVTPKEWVEIQAKRPQETKAVQGVMGALHSSLQAADNVLNSEGLGRITGPVAGRTPNFTGAATNAQSDLDTLKSQIGVQVLTAMREASKTGGAVGNVTEKEWPILQNQLGALQQAQTTDQFKERLGDVKATLQRMQDNARQAYEANYGRLDWTPPAKTPDAPKGVVRWEDLGR